MTMQNVYVGLLYDGSWHDVTADVYARDAIRISRGKASYTDAPKPTSMFLTFGNRSQKYDPRNPQSPLYGKVGRNTPIMVGYNPVDEDFEDAAFNVTMTPSGAAAWARTNAQAHGGSWSLKSGTITHGQQSNVFVTVPAGANTVQFWYRVDSEEGFDYFVVYTDQGIQLFDSGFRDWTFASVDVAGSATVVFSYQKDASTSVGADAAWIDDLRFIDARGTGEISSWKPAHTADYKRSLGTASSGDAWTAVEAYGLLSRIGQSSDPIRSALYRATTMAAPAPAAYWPLEDADGSAKAVSGIGGAPLSPVTNVRYTLPDGTPIPPGGAPKFQQDGGVPGADKLVSFTDGGTLRGKLPIIPDTGYAIDFVFRFNPGGNDGTVSADIAGWRESGTYVHFTVNVDPTSITVFHSNAADDALLSFTGSATAAVNVYDGTPHHFRYTVSQSGGNYLARLYIDGTLRATAVNFVPPMAGTVGHPTVIEFNPGEDRGEYMPVAIGHVTVWATATPPATAPAAFGNPGERAGDRLKRFGREQGWPVVVRNDVGDTMPMGPQSVDTLANHVAEIERTEDGMIVDQRGAIGLRLRTRSSQYNQTPRLAITAGTLEAIKSAVPDQDDLRVSNDVTIKNYDGTEARSVLASGPLSVQAPPNGVGRYEQTVAVNADTRTVDLTALAGWWRNRGTVDQPRYASVVVFADKFGLAAAAGAVDAGDRITIDGLEPDLIDLRVVGVSETIEVDFRMIEFLCEPYQLFDVGVYDDPSSRYDSATTTVAAPGAAAGAVTIPITSTNRNDAWVNPASIDPRTGAAYGQYDLMIAGERVTVTAASAPVGTGPITQTLTVVRSKNGVVKALPAGAQVQLAEPARYAL